MKNIASNIHFGMTLVLLLSTVPALKAAGLPLRFDWEHFFTTFWIGLTVQSAFFACLLYVAAFPLRETIAPVWDRYRQQKPRLLILALLWAQLYYIFGPIGLLYLSLVSVAILEFSERTREESGGFLRAVTSIAIPGAYWFIGLILVFSLNQAVIALKPHAANDAVLNRMDSWLLLGSTVPELAHRAYKSLPLGLLSFFDLLYFAMFAQVGAVMILIALRLGRKRAFQLVATVVTASYLSLFFYYFWPSLSPFYSCLGHFDALPQTLRSYPIQQGLLAYVTIVRDHRPLGEIGTGYFIAFPCMHVAAPTIALWFVRQWRRLVYILLALDALLCVAIVLLEFHYVADLIGGVAVAAIAIALNRRAGNGKPEVARPCGQV
ncbi:MAG: phosphatase PAP2 family protein [Acidobacteria bacterium]|nr:phosphatase PAP2 family protein [Acidobacteriota bacterium]